MEPSSPSRASATPASDADATVAIKPRLRLATFSDLEGIARCWYDGFFDDEVIGEIMHPNRKQFPEDVYWFLLRGVRERFWNWKHRFIVTTVEEAGKERVVGAAEWRRLGEGGRAMELWNIDPRNLIRPSLHLYHQVSLKFFPNRAANPTRSSFLSAAVADSSHFWTGNRAECWDLHVCGVHPDYQGKGVGRMLVSWGVEKAAKEGACASVICGDKNRGFYAKGGLTEEAGRPGNGEGGGIVLFSAGQKEHGSG